MRCPSSGSLKSEVSLILRDWSDSGGSGGEERTAEGLVDVFVPLIVHFWRLDLRWSRIQLGSIPSARR